jgi:nicotinamidase-related amidase
MNAHADPLHQSALLIVDMINDFGFPNGEKLVIEAEKAVEHIAMVRTLFRDRGCPVIYVNDNFDQWNFGFSELVDWARRHDSRGRAIVERLLPAEDDYFILKPRHSAFYETALPSLLDRLDVRRLAIVGVAGDACVLSSALDAYIRRFPVWVPANASASLTGQRNVRAMEFLAESLGCDTHPIGSREGRL